MRQACAVALHELTPVNDDYPGALDRVVAHAARSPELPDRLFVARAADLARAAVQDARPRKKSGVPGGRSSERARIIDTGVPDSVREDL